MLKLGIATTMAGAPWGGSEELWFDTALQAAKSNVAVSVCVDRPWIDPTKRDRLLQAGASVCGGRPASPIARDIASRCSAISYRLGVRMQQRLSPLPGFLRQPHDVVFISDGAGIPTMRVMQAAGNLQPGTAYVTICHNLPPASMPKDMQQAASAYFDNAHASLFSSALVHAQTEQLLCHRIPRGHVVHNPVNLRSLSPIAWPEADGLRMATVGRLDVAMKGHDLLFKALAGEAWRHRRWTLSVFGTGPDEAYLPDLARFLGLQDRIEFRGHAGDIAAIWRDHHLLVQPSRLDLAPLTIVEAMISARPVVATAVGGITEWVTDGQSGFIAAAPTAELVGEALERAWAAQGSLRDMGLLARHEALARYDPNPGETVLSFLREAAAARAR